jgi:hypothetical protein
MVWIVCLSASLAAITEADKGNADPRPVSIVGSDADCVNDKVPLSGFERILLLMLVASALKVAFKSSD